MTDRQQNKYNKWLLWVISFSSLIYYFNVRLLLGAIDVKNNTGISEMEIASLVGVFYIGYSIMQIPSSILLRVFNTFRLGGLVLLINALSLIPLLYGNVDYMWIGRVFASIASAFAVHFVIRICSLFFSNERDFMISLTCGISVMVAAFTNPMISYIYSMLGYYTTVKMFIFIGVVMAVITTSHCGAMSNISVEDKTNNIDFSNLAKILFRPLVLLSGICGGLMVGAFETLPDYWGGAYVAEVLELNSLTTITASIIFVSAAIGFVILPLFANWIRSDIIIITLCGILMIGGIMYLISYEHTYSTAFTACIIIGLGCSYQTVIFQMIGKLVKRNEQDISLAIINSLNMIFGAVFNNIIANVSELNKGLPISERYYVSLSVIPQLCLIGTIGFVFIYLFYRNKINASIYSMAKC